MGAPFHTGNMTDPLHRFIDQLQQSLATGSFVKLTLANYQGAEPDLQKILTRKILVKKVEHLSFTYRYQTRDVVKNAPLDTAAGQVATLLRDFKAATLFTTAADWQLGNGRLKQLAASQTTPASLEHDRGKKRAIGGERPWLHALGITDANGQVLSSAQDKYRQINHYIELLEPLLARLPRPLRVADMGAGKGYLTFALYDHLTNALGIDAQVTGVEARAEMVQLCNRIAAEAGFSGLRFVQNTIADFDSRGTQLLIALHACDTATDDAIASGIAAQAEAIVVAPCCHKQIRREMDAAAPPSALDFLLKHGTFMERQAEMVTDGLRALLLEQHGYRTKVFEFISDAHTPKNIMITAQRGPLPSPARRAELAEQIAAAKSQFGIGRHYLESKLA